MQRRDILKAGAAASVAFPAGLARPALAQPAANRVLKFIPQSDIAVVDPIVTTAYVTRNHAYLIYDTLYGIDADFKPQPQMAEGHATEDGGRRVAITLRQGLKFHDGEPVRARDAVASIRRWAQRDAMGQALMAATDELVAEDDRRITFRLKRPFPLLFDALAKPSSPDNQMVPSFTLGVANSRMKDFYDLWMIARTFRFDRAVLTAALRRTPLIRLAAARQATFLPGPRCLRQRPGLLRLLSCHWHDSFALRAQTGPERGRRALKPATLRDSCACPKCRDPASGQTWAGRGQKPRWLAAAIASGKKLEDFAQACGMCGGNPGALALGGQDGRDALQAVAQTDFTDDGCERKR